MNADNVTPLIQLLHCPRCHTEISYKTDFQNSQPLKKGNIIVCGECGSILQMGDADLRAMTKQAVKSLDAQSRATVIMLAASVVHNKAIRRTRNN